MKYVIDSNSVTVYNKYMQENEQHFTIEELAEQTGLPVRTIRYYITEGLLPGPGARGKAALYGEEHLLKLRLIRRLSERRMPLAEMQDLLSHLSLTEVRALLAEEEQRAHELERAAQQPSPKEYIEKLLQSARTAQQSTPATSPYPTRPGKRPVVPPAQPSPPSPARPGTMPNPQVSASLTNEVWRRWELAPGVELHIRSDAEHRFRSLIERLFKAADMVFRPSQRE